ncbi:MAG: FAD-dependent oxidoreductase [Candidatus Thermoplasmatota archaeon]|jgi:sulfide:quinone oxidoreductase|nr:FAD-dependent oxidoreductase [Candidatus Thermoplasmatota archaeon]
MTMKKVLIIGGGGGGLILANHLDTNEYDVTVVDKSDQHFYQPWFLYVAFKGSKRKISKPIGELIKPGVNFVKDEISTINLDEKKAYGSRKGIYDYDYIAIATGTVPDPDVIPGLRQVYEEYGDYHTNVWNSEKLWSHVSKFKGGTIAIGQASPTCKCPPSLLEGAFLLEEHLRKVGLKDKTRIVFFTPFPRAYPAEPMNKVVEPMVRERGIEVMPFFDVDTIDVQNKTITSLEGDSLKYDLPIVVPPCRGTKIKIIPETVQDEDRFIKADKKYMKIAGYDDAFAIGDCNTLPTSKTGVTAHLEAMAVSEIIQGRYAEFNGRINCPFDTAYGKATFVIADYNNPVAPYPPTRVKHMMKMTMARIYWMTLMGTADPIFEQFFKFTRPEKLNKKYATSE